MSLDVTHPEAWEDEPELGTFDCEACHGAETLEYEDDNRLAFKCCDCGARYEVEGDADYDGDHYIDCSTPGKRIKES